MKLARRYPCAMWSSSMSNPAASAIRAAWTNWSRTTSISRRSISRGTWLCGKYGSGEAEMAGQFPSGSGSSIPSHMRRVEPLRPAWASWRAMRPSAAAVHELDRIALPGVDVLGLVHPRAARADPPLAAHVGHLGDDEGRPAGGPAAEMDEVPVVRRAVLGRVLAHRRHHDTVGEDEVPQPERREHRRRGVASSGSARRSGGPRPRRTTGRPSRRSEDPAP